jgi:hypothetical protein
MKNEQTETPTTDEIVNYDASIAQEVPLKLTKGTRSYRVTHNLQPLSNDRYFEMQDDLEATALRLTKISTKAYEPKDRLWKDLVTSVTGYKDRSDWKDGVPFEHRTEAINALIFIHLNDEPPTKADDLWDIEELVDIPFHAMQSGVLITDLVHSFRSETKEEMDEFLSIEAGDTSSNNLASAQKLSKAERLYRLGKKLLKSTSGYAPGTEVPAWHLASTTESFFLRQVAQARG